ncbi:MAG TPA: ComEC/Rec2 family competence protein, partial [Paraburkholderia sp.]|uniref:ComEC/Rec2 family competence protein n=1 Tax=Paraburkholderia sp. TaxID=1926495 RepID=UPI002ED6AC59
MRTWWCGFALGVIWLQQQAALPGLGAGCAVVSLGLAALAAAVWLLRDRSSIESGCHAAHESDCQPAYESDCHAAHESDCRATHENDCHAAHSHWTPRRLRSFAGWSALWCAALCAGFGFAAWRADMRLATSLPLEWEGCDVEVTGSMQGLPAREDNGARFLFNVESARAPGVEPDARAPVNFPRVIQLSWIADEAPPPPLEPGDRWRLRVRLKRPHGNANFGVRDAEAALLARNVRATGYVSAATQAERLRARAQGIGVTVDRWRAALRTRIDAVLASAPHRGIVVALAIGAQDEVSNADWQLMRATGTSHLVAISGLHIGFAASLAAWLAGAFWRRSGWFGRNWPLWLPAQIVAVMAGTCFAALHAALAGFNVPVQRALWMAGVVALAYVSGRNLVRSAVLAWALGLVLLIDPWAVVSAGFWLSFCAVAAILFATSGRPRVRNHEQHTQARDETGVAPGALSRL